MLDEEKFYDDEDYDNFYDDEWDDGLDEYECLFPSRCIAIGFHHHQDECHTAEMAYEQDKYYREMQLEEEYPIMKLVYSIRDWFKSPRFSFNIDLFKKIEEDDIPF